MRKFCIPFFGNFFIYSRTSNLFSVPWSFSVLEGVQVKIGDRFRPPKKVYNGSSFTAVCMCSY